MATFNRTIRVPLLLKAGTAFTVSATAYTANDVVGGSAKVYYGTGGGALLMGFSLLDDAVQSEPYIVHIYKSAPSVIADHAAFAPTTADGKLELRTITVLDTDYEAANGGTYSVAHKYDPSYDQVALPEECEGTIYVYLECTSTPDYAATTDLYAEFVFWVD